MAIIEDYNKKCANFDNSEQLSWYFVRIHTNLLYNGLKVLNQERYESGSFGTSVVGIRQQRYVG